MSGLGRYAARMHARAGAGHHVVSPLGAWLVVALCGPLARDQAIRDELADALGTDPDEAAKLAAELLADPHPVIGAAAGLWSRAGTETPPVRDWRSTLPDRIETGDLPDQAALDRWAQDRTQGLIQRFPLRLDPDVVLVLATALATKVSWETPFDVVDVGELGESRWSTRLTRVLRAPVRDHRHRQFFARSARAGTVGVHLARAQGGLLVGSVIAVDESMSAADVLAAAEEIVAAQAQGHDVERVSLFDLPLDGPLWSMTEDAVATTAPDGREEQVRSVLPAWEAETDLSLLDPSLGFPAAATAIAAALGLGDWRYDAHQAAMARYTDIGFEAAAVTAVGVAMAAMRGRPGVRRTATLRFPRPYAVVAAVTDDRADPSTAGAAWHGLPVFSAWVTEPMDAVRSDRS